MYPEKKPIIVLNENEEVILKVNAVFVNGFIPDNPYFGGTPYFGGRESRMEDGIFIITNQRIYFYRKKPNFPRCSELSIKFSEISKVEEKNLFILLPFFIVFNLSNGNELKFSFGFGRKKPLELLQTLLKK